MSQITINLQGIDPVEFLGVHNGKLDLLRKAFPAVRILSRGNRIKISGRQEGVAQLKHRIDLILQYLGKYGYISENVMQGLLTNTSDFEEIVPSYADDVIVVGPTGVPVRAKTPNQLRLMQQSQSSDIIFATGPAGTGKTYTAVALAVRALKDKQVRRIILARPAVEAGESLGFLPGDIKEKIDPYLRPLYDALDDMLPPEKIRYYIETRVIEVAPLAFMRGRTLDKSFVILDEAQNATDMQIKMFLTRMGPSAKCIITGDLTQIDLPFSQKSGLVTAIHILKNIEGIGFINFDEKDVIRHRLVSAIIKSYEKYESRGMKKDNKPDKTPPAT